MTMNEEKADNRDETQLAELQAAYDPTISTEAPEVWESLEPSVRGRLEQNRSVIDRLSRIRPIDRAVHSFPLPRRFGRFVLRRQLGMGGCGVVFLADDPLLGREVALKVPRPDTLVNVELQRRFLREGQAAALLSHPNIVPIFEANVVGTVCFTASEYCPGPNLAEWLKRNPGLLPTAAIVKLLSALAYGIGYAHRRGVVHRDIKPSNILLLPGVGETLSDYVPRITDFGFAKLLDRDQSETQIGVLVGTPLYMAPEQAEGKTGSIGPATDVFALGVVLYELLVGKHPLVGCSTPEVLRRIVYDSPPSIRSLRSDVHRDLEAICLKCLEKDPSRRYPDGDALSQDLGRYLVCKATIARPVRLPERARNCARRNLIVTILLLLLLITLPSLTALSLVFHATLEKGDAAIGHAHEREKKSAIERDREHQLAANLKRVLRRQTYLSGIRSATEAADHGRLTHRMLNFWDPEDDLRGFEWRYLDRLLPASRIWGRHSDVLALRFSVDGRWAVSASLGELRVWDAALGRVAYEWQCDSELIGPVAVSPDGLYAVAASLRGTGVLVFRQGSRTPRLLTNTRGVVHWIRFAEGNRLLILKDGCLLVSDAASGDMIGTVSFASHYPRGMDVCEDGHTAIAIFCKDCVHWRGPNEIVEYDVRSGRQTLRGTLPVKVQGIEASAERRYLLYTSEEKEELRVWDITRQTDCSRFAFPKGTSVNRVGHLADGRLAGAAWPDVVGGTQELTIAVWNPRNNQWDSNMVALPCPLRTAQFHPDGRSLLIAGRDSSVVSVDVVPPEREIGWQATGKSEAWALAISPDSQTIVTGGDDHVVRLWDARTGCKTGELNDHWSLVTKAVFDPTGAWFATGSFDGRVIVRDARSGKPRRILSHGHLVRTLAVSPDGRLLAAAGDAGRVNVWDVESGDLRYQLSGAASVVHAIVFSADGKRLLLAPDENELIWWDLLNDQRLRASDFCQRPSCMAIQPGSTTVAVGYETGEIVFIATGDGRELGRAIGPHSRLNSLALSPDGRTLAAASIDGCVRLWNVDSATELLLVHAKGRQVNEVVFSPDGKYIAGTCHDGRLLIWPAN